MDEYRLGMFRQRFHPRFIAQNTAFCDLACRVYSEYGHLVTRFNEHVTKGFNKCTFTGPRHTSNTDAQRLAGARQYGL